LSTFFQQIFFAFCRFTDDLFSEYKSMLEEQEMNIGFYPDSDQDEDDDYDSDPPATLPKLTKQHEYKFKDIPSQLFRHLMLDRKRKNEHLIFLHVSFGHDNLFT
jgi:hypothetical protein